MLQIDKRADRVIKMAKLIGNATWAIIPCLFEEHWTLLLLFKDPRCESEPKYFGNEGNRAVFLNSNRGSEKAPNVNNLARVAFDAAARAMWGDKVAQFV